MWKQQIKSFEGMWQFVSIWHSDDDNGDGVDNDDFLRSCEMGERIRTDKNEFYELKFYF